MLQLGNLTQINLNLLLSLKALLEERSVSHAAAKLHITQPTMSRNLACLRDYFQDPLLVRSGKDYMLTALAQCLREKLDIVINGIESLFSLSFEPAVHPRQFTLAVPDYVAQYVLVDALAFMLTMDSKLRFAVLNWDARAKEMLINGDVHFAVSIDDKIPACIKKRVVDEDELVVAARGDHPLAARDELSVEDFTSFAHLNVMTGGGWAEAIDGPLREMGEKREVKLKLTSYGAAFAALKNTNLVAVLPRHVVRNSQAQCPLMIRALPFDSPRVKMSLLWHECHQNDPAHTWLRENLFPKILGHPHQRGLSASKCGVQVTQQSRRTEAGAA